MEKLINILKELIKTLGLPEWLVNELTFVLTFLLLLTFLINQLIRLIRWFILWRNQRLLNRDLHPFYTKAEVDNATRYYVDTHFQNVAPSEDEEPGRKYIASARNKLIPLLLNKAFRNDKDDNKYYLILADAGMGKTTFMINLFLRYKKQWNWNNRKYNILLLPLGRKDTLTRIDEMKFEEKKNTILLLDAFDEDNEAVVNYNKRMQEILEKIEPFREIVITCRTQFFPSQKEEPHETGYFRLGGKPGEFLFQKLYLSVFNDKDVKRYLRQRYNYLNPFNWKKLRKAYGIADKSPNLMVRPMLLSFIDDLLSSNKSYEYTYELYEVMIEKWIEREADKPGIKIHYGSQEKYKKLLHDFSQKLAIDLYDNREKRGGLFIHKDEKFGISNGVQLEDIEKQETDELSESEKRSRSLLNRNAEGYYKFAHKSILEYFLAKQLIEDVEFFKRFNFTGMEAAKRFFEELLVEKLKITDGEYAISAFIQKEKISDVHDLHNTLAKKSKPLKELKLPELNQIAYLKVKSITHLKEPLLLGEIKSLQSLTIFDWEAFKNLYYIYLLFWRELLELGERRELLQLLKLGELPERLKRLERLERLELRELLELLEERLKRQEPLYLLELLKNKDEALIAELKAANAFLIQMKTLQAALPECKMYY